jgi:hypothetical protein
MVEPMKVASSPVDLRGQVDALHTCGHSNIETVVDQDLRGSPGGGVTHPAHQIVESSAVQISLADLNHFNAVPNRGAHVRHQIAVTTVRDIAADHSTIRFGALRDRTRRRSSEIPMRMSIPPSNVTPARKTLWRITGRIPGT